jgi:hypothetical protein
MSRTNVQMLIKEYSREFPRFNLFRVVKDLVFLFCIVALSGCGRCGGGSYYTKGIHEYSGDGVIRDISQPSGLFGTRGYAIEFPSFDLGQEHEATYHLSGLPKLGNAQAQICLLINDPSVEPLKATLTAKVMCSLTDAAGRTIATFESPLKQLIWSSPIHDRFGYDLYDLDKSFFVPQPGEKYTLHVKYLGDRALSSKTGLIYVWCGCGGS